MLRKKKILSKRIRVSLLIISRSKKCREPYRKGVTGVIVGWERDPFLLSARQLLTDYTNIEQNCHAADAKNTTNQIQAPKWRRSWKSMGLSEDTWAIMK